MRRAILAALAAAVLAAAAGPAAALSGTYEVHGVEDEDMLKMRAGPGTGYRVILGLPNGTALRVHNCQQTGSTRWCKVSISGTRGLKGYVSWAYLRKQ